jgi:protein-disulfide isomerase
VAQNPTVQAPKRRDKGSVPTSSTSGSWLTPRRLIVLVAAGVVVIGGILIGVSVAGSGGSSSSSGVSGAAATQTLFKGIPQQGFVLGNPKAPVTLVEYGDLQCPICREFAVATLPTIVRDYVRTGKVKLEFRGLAFIGADSEKALKAAVAAGAQSRGWNMIDLLYRNQGQENTGWVTDSRLEAFAAAIPGLAVKQWLGDRNTTATQSKITTMRGQALSLMGSRLQTPTFEVGRTGQQLQYLPITSLDAGAFTPALDQLLSG